MARLVCDGQRGEFRAGVSPRGGLKYCVANFTHYTANFTRCKRPMRRGWRRIGREARPDQYHSASNGNRDHERHSFPCHNDQQKCPYSFGERQSGEHDDD